ncbi:MAG: hypothetical protein ABSA58_24990 [Acetobacteraceae bacterium]|jgi:hypothetical protein
MNRGIVVRSLASGLAMLALAACSPGSMNPGGGASSESVGPSGEAAENRTSLQTQQACRERANQIVDEQRRPDIYAPNSSLNTPFSANFQPDVPSRGLSGQFAYERTEADCERNAGAPDVSTTTVPSTIPPNGR